MFIDNLSLTPEENDLMAASVRHCLTTYSETIYI